MSQSYDPVPDIERLGYTEREATFLYLVAIHSGYSLRVSTSTSSNATTVRWCNAFSIRERSASISVPSSTRHADDTT